VSDLIFKSKISGLDITTFIRELILLNECVILRGLGGFETTYKHAAFRKNKKAITPPSKHVNFRPELLKDNGVLENYIQNSTGCSVENASNEIENFVVKFFEQLHKSGSVLLEGIGEFVKDDNNKLKFKEIEDVNYLADSFGLDILDINNKPQAFENTEEYKPSLVVSGRRKLTGWYVVIGVLLIVIAVTFIILISESTKLSLFNFNAENRKKSQQHIIVFGPQNPTGKDSLTSAIEETINNNTLPKSALAIAPKSTEEAAPLEKPAKSVSEEVSFYLIAGTFKNARNADLMMEQLLRKGFAPRIYHKEGDYYRVVIGSFSDRQAAIDELRRIRKQIDQSVWLWERN